MHTDHVKVERASRDQYMPHGWLLAVRTGAVRGPLPLGFETGTAANLVRRHIEALPQSQLRLALQQRFGARVFLRRLRFREGPRYSDRTMTATLMEWASSVG